VRFTVKYRAAEGKWQWANEQSAVGDAEVLFSSNKPISSLLSDYLQGLDPSLQVIASEENARNDRPIDTHVYSVSGQVPAAEGDKSGFSYMKLGLPAGFLRWFCLARESKPWLCPRQGRDNFNPSEDAILVSFLCYDGLHLVLLAPSFGDVLITMNSDANGKLVAVVRNEQPRPRAASILIAVGKTFESANKAVMDEARAIIERDAASLGRLIQAEMNKITPESLESWYNGFAYCTWNGLGQNLTDEMIHQALETMENSGIHISTIIIDDNWQSIDSFGENNFHHRWLEFEADKKAFSHGLKHTISTIKDRHPHVEHIAVWHGILGYWNGIAPGGAIAKSYKTKVLRKQDSGFFGGGSLIAVDPDDAHQLYDDFYQCVSRNLWPT
jgi:hypothetical protein